MSDKELVEQGRAVERDLNNGFPMTCEKGRVIQEMASRIEALTARADAAEAELAKAKADARAAALRDAGYGVAEIEGDRT